MQHIGYMEVKNSLQCTQFCMGFNSMGTQWEVLLCPDSCFSFVDQTDKKQ